MSCVGLFNGFSQAALQVALTNAQQAYLDLTTGVKGESFSYTQGDGSKSVTYTRANLSELVALIRQLQQQLGIVRNARKPMRFRF